MLHRNFIKKVRDRIGGQIYYGPFATLQIPDALYPHLTIGETIGTYEMCLHDVFNKLITERPQHIMIIGANNGYYCAGLAYTIRPQKLTAFEMVPHLQQLAQEWWKVNDLSPMTMKGEATPAELSNIAEPVDFLLCDCEGAEDELLRPEQYTWQKRSAILVELHDFYKPGLMQRLIERFDITHTAQIIMDDHQESDLNDKILSAVDLSYRLVRFKIANFPNHRWIPKKGHKALTFGKFLYLCPRQTAFQS